MGRAPPNPDATVDPGELHKFDRVAAGWWDPDGPLRPLHDINALRMDYIDARAPVEGRRVLDVGCGGGLLAEGLARRGARVTGIDRSEAALAAARLHRLESGVTVDYRDRGVADLAAEEPGGYDIVTCLELLEHSPDPPGLLAACGRLVKPDGHLFVSTINRNTWSYLLAIVGAEYLLGLLPRGTHDYAKLIRPSELAGWLRTAGLELRELTGLHYEPVTRRAWLTADLSVNYFAHARRAGCDEA